MREKCSGSFPADWRREGGGNGRQPSFCLFRAKTRPVGPRGDPEHMVGQPYADGGPDATGANVGAMGTKVG